MTPLFLFFWSKALYHNRVIYFLFYVHYHLYHNIMYSLFRRYQAILVIFKILARFVLKKTLLSSAFCLVFLFGTKAPISSAPLFVSFYIQDGKSTRIVKTFCLFFKFRQKVIMCLKSQNLFCIFYTVAENRHTSSASRCTRIQHQVIFAVLNSIYGVWRQRVHTFQTISGF